ncbi:flagellar motor switch protein FliM [Hydrogenoanaerobacterium sp.]|uniref:flagellar motor switch protein FliM n=1 Tax=Hydrogenoanaerobacterium sp. TaxID=2953763 RepID=UPI00289644E5|nr:flagellar motor switch protein FliM [Hydrogenoanaerobacterium sp.]
MPEILSQSQIDALLTNLGKGEPISPQESSAGGRRIKEYDFKSPKKFTKERLRTLESMHENLARSITSYFTSMLREYCEVSVLQIEEQRYFEYSNALPDIALVGLIDLNPLDPNISETTLTMDMSTTIGFFMIDRLLGGAGEGYNLDREFTDIEKTILAYVYEKFAHYVEEAWGTSIDAKASFRGLETNSRLLQVNAQEDIVVIVVLNAKIRNVTGKISICIPATSLEEMSDSFSSKYTRSTRKMDADKEKQRKQVIMNSIMHSDLELKARLHEFELGMHDVLQLQVGDIIPLNKNINSDIQVLVEDVPWFTAKLGKIKTRKAVKVNKFM